MSADDTTNEAVLGEPSLVVDAAEEDELHFKSHPVNRTESPLSDATPSMEEDNVSIRGESVPKPLGSVDTLDTIALETSPTMESLDLGDSKSLDRVSMQFDIDKGICEEMSDGTADEQAVSDIKLEDGEPVDVQKEMEGISLNDTATETLEVMETLAAGADNVDDHFEVSDTLTDNFEVSNTLADNFEVTNTLADNFEVDNTLDDNFEVSNTLADDLEVSNTLADNFEVTCSTPADNFEGNSTLTDNFEVQCALGDLNQNLAMETEDDRNKLSSYFSSVPSNGDNIFDTIAENVSQESPEEEVLPISSAGIAESDGVHIEPALVVEDTTDQAEDVGGTDFEIRPSVTPPGKQESLESSEPIEIIHQRHRNTSASIETPVVSFEGEAITGDAQNEQSTVSQFFSDDTESNKEGKEFFDHFTSEGTGDSIREVPLSQAPPETEDNKLPENVPKEKRKPSGAPYVLPHLSPGPSPNTSAYASPVHHAHITPTPTPTATPLHRLSEKMPFHSPQHYSEEITGLPAFSHSITEPEDAFSASLHMNEADRHCDVWIPSDLTRQTLVSMITSPPGTFYPKQDQLTMPGLLANDPQGDPVQDLLKRCIGEHEAMKRQSLSADNVLQDEEGLRQLIRAECWRSAVDLTGRLLTLHGQGLGKVNIESKNTPQTLQLWFTRLAILMKLKLYSLADNENAAFGNFDKPDLFYEYYPDTYPGRKGSMVPFSFRVISAELPHFLGRSQEALDKLYYVYAIVKKIIGNLDNGLTEDGSMMELTDENRRASKDLWEKREMRVLFSIVNILVGIKTYDTAVDVLELLIKRDLEKGPKIAILSGLGRLYMQMGDVESARTYFDEVSELIEDKDEMGKCRIKINKGFLSLGQNDFDTAKGFFKEVAEIDPTNAVAVNNMAVCYLYMGKLKEALQILEDLVHQNPGRYLQEGILINLCTLYELESSRALHKKQALLELVSKYKGNGFNVTCLKMGELLAKK